mmetsp:Transcript_7931/g.19497  ORF Transcript_7931/g.19497 Transcript_7931/m.19497 type:complete len:86 (-) Transcript_7931:131-388(-)
MTSCAAWPARAAPNQDAAGSRSPNNHAQPGQRPIRMLLDQVLPITMQLLTCFEESMKETVHTGKGIAASDEERLPRQVLRRVQHV